MLFLSIFKIWSFESNRYFLFVGDYGSAAIIMGVTFILGWVLEKLWKWEVHTLFWNKRIRRRR